MTMVSPIQAPGSCIRVYLPVVSTIDAAVRSIEGGTGLH